MYKVNSILNHNGFNIKNVIVCKIQDKYYFLKENVSLPEGYIYSRFELLTDIFCI